MATKSALYLALIDPKNAVEMRVEECGVGTPLQIMYRVVLTCQGAPQLHSALMPYPEAGQAAARVSDAITAHIRTARRAAESCRLTAPTQPHTDTIDEDMRRSRTEPSGLERELEKLLNRYSAENESDTPDFILAAYVRWSLRAFDAAVRAREKWYGRGPKPADAPQETGA